VLPCVPKQLAGAATRGLTSACCESGEHMSSVQEKPAGTLHNVPQGLAGGCLIEPLAPPLPSVHACCCRAAWSGGSVTWCCWSGQC
jgi:hypothetical protein